MGSFRNVNAENLQMDEWIDSIIYWLGFVVWSVLWLQFY